MNERTWSFSRVQKGRLAFGTHEPILPVCRILRWQRTLREVELVHTLDRINRIEGEGDHWHYHQAYELTLVETGEGMRFVGDGMAPFGEGDLVLLGKNLPHYWKVRGTSSGVSVQWHFGARHPLWSFPETENLSSFLSAADRGIQFGGETAKRLRVQLRHLPATQGLDRFGLLLRTLATMAEAPQANMARLSSTSFTLSVGESYHSGIYAAIQFMSDNFRDELWLGKILKVAGMSKPTFSRQFKRYTGMTFNRFLQKIRLEATCRDLAETDRPIIDIAYANGFSEISFFNRLFQRELKCTPSEYRRRFPSSLEWSSERSRHRCSRVAS